MMLEKELKIYEEHLSEWLKTNSEKYVLIKGSDVIGFFNTFNEALEAGTRLFGLQSFLIRQVLPSQEEINIPALTLGILHADPEHAVHR
jgi:hypothetical protein